MEIGDTTQGQPRLKDAINDAVRLALIEEKQADHEKRIGALESIAWKGLIAISSGALCSVATLLLLLIEGKR